MRKALDLARNSLTPPTAAEVLQRQVDFLTRFYSLTTAQVGPVTTIVSTEQSCLPTSAAMRTAREALVTAIKTEYQGLRRGDRR